MDGEGEQYLQQDVVYSKKKTFGCKESLLTNVLCVLKMKLRVYLDKQSGESYQ